MPSSRHGNSPQQQQQQQQFSLPSFRDPPNNNFQLHAPSQPSQRGGVPMVGGFNGGIGGGGGGGGVGSSEHQAVGAGAKPSLFLATGRPGATAGGGSSGAVTRRDEASELVFVSSLSSLQYTTSHSWVCACVVAGAFLCLMSMISTATGVGAKAPKVPGQAARATEF